MVSLAVVGCGHWGQNLVRNFAELGVLRAVVDNNSDLAAKFANDYDIEALSFEQTLEDPALEALVIAAPAELHKELTLQGISAGKHIYVEKPLALSVADGEEMKRAADSANRILMIGHLLQYHPVFTVLRDHVARGGLGKLHYAYSHRLSMGKFRVEEDAFWSLAPHDVSMLLSLFNEEPAQVRCSGKDFVTPGIADEARLDMTFADGARAHVFASWMHPFKEQRLVVAGDQGMAVFDDTLPWEQKLAYYNHVIDVSGPVPVVKKADPFYPEIAQSEPLKTECQHFIDCITAGSSPLTDAAEALRVLRVLAAQKLPHN